MFNLLKKQAVMHVLMLWFLGSVSAVHASTLTDVGFAELSGDRFEVRLDFDALPVEPTGYTIEQPARIVLDFPGIENALQQRKFSLPFDNAKSAIVLSSNDRTRLILNLSELEAYTTRQEGNSYVVEVGQSNDADYLVADNGVSEKIAPTQDSVDSASKAIDNVDFRRSEEGEGKIIIGLTNPAVSIDVEQKNNLINILFMGAILPEELQRSLDVTDFATPVSKVVTDYDGKNTQVSVTVSGDYDYLAYQADNEYVVSVKPLTQEELEEKKSRFAFVGDKLSLNFQDIEVRSVLQLIADFTELNLVASDTVSGSITLRLENVPWDQALDLVLKTKGLDKRQIGNVLMVAPAEEIAERERQELETKKQLNELAPLQTEYIRIRYANAADIFALFGSAEETTNSILSERGSAIVDERTNSIILTETADKIAEFQALITQIDIPIKQVMIESRIVIATSDFREEMGIKWGGIGVGENESSLTGVGGTLASLDSVDGFFGGTGTNDNEESLAVDLGVTNPAGSFAMSFLASDVLLTMELSALENSGHAELVSQPKVITGDKQQATIESGQEIPYQEATSSGAAAISFKSAVLKMDVTPQITPDNNVIMDLVIDQDSIGTETSSGVPTIDTTSLMTQVLVANGQTVVLGGIFETQLVESVTKVPLLGDIPVLGKFFKRDTFDEEKRELLIFITPRILSDELVK